MQSEEFTNKKSKKSTSKQKQTSSSSAPAKKSSSSSSKPAKKSSTSGSKPAKKGSTSGSAPAKKSSTPSTLSNKPKGNSNPSTNGKKNNKNIWTNNPHGEQNQEDTVRDAIGGSAVRYKGNYTGIDYAGSKGARNKPIDGKADMNVNFGNNSATLRIHNAYSTAISVYDMQIKGNDMTGHQVYPNNSATVRGTKTWGRSYTPGFAGGVISSDKTNIKGTADVYYYNAYKANVQYNINKEAH